MTKKQIEKKVQECLDLVILDIPVPVIEIARKLEIEVHEVVLSSDEYSTISAILTNNNNQRMILLNETELPTQKRFAVAHMLGHAVLHQDQDRIDSFQLGEALVKKGADQEEKEASYFALCILMPTLELKEAWQEVQDIERLSKMFYVSYVSLSARLQSLNLAEGVI